jgi:hypothetical protein
MLDSKNGYDPISKSMAIAEMSKIESFSKVISNDESTKAHRAHLKWLIDQSRK